MKIRMKILKELINVRREDYEHGSIVFPDTDDEQFAIAFDFLNGSNCLESFLNTLVDTDGELEYCEIMKNGIYVDSKIIFSDTDLYDACPCKIDLYEVLASTDEGSQSSEEALADTFQNLMIDAGSVAAIFHRGTYKLTHERSTFDSNGAVVNFHQIYELAKWLKTKKRVFKQESDEYQSLRKTMSEAASDSQDEPDVTGASDEHDDDTNLRTYYFLYISSQDPLNTGDAYHTTHAVFKTRQQKAVWGIGEIPGELIEE